MSVILSGTAVSDSLNKTAKVRIVYSVMHSKYRKIIRRTKNHLVHDERGEVKKGQVVSIALGRPISARKKFVVVYGD